MTDYATPEEAKAACPPGVYLIVRNNRMRWEYVSMIGVEETQFTGPFFRPGSPAPEQRESQAGPPQDHSAEGGGEVAKVPS